MSEPAYSTREIQRKNYGKPSTPKASAPYRPDASSNLEGSRARGYSTRWSEQRTREITEQKRVVAQREAQRRQQESYDAQARQLDSEIASTSSRLQNLKRQRAEAERTRPSEATFG